MKAAIRLLGLALFASSLGLLAWWWGSIGTTSQSPGGVHAAVVDVLLFSAFALHHSLFARSSVKRFVERVIPVGSVRSVYVCVAGLLLIVMCLSWQRLGGLVYSATGLAAAVLLALQVTGAATGIAAIRRINVAELAGMVEPRRDEHLQGGGAYRVVRHPLYLAVVLILFGTRQMTDDRLLFALLTTVYVIVAIPFEEAALRHQFGHRYLEYRQQVRWRLIPYIH